MIREKIVQWEMKESLEEKQLITIIIAEQDVVWEETGKECRINGRLFDVKEFDKINGQYRLKGLYDEREKEIEEQLANMTKKQNEQQEKLIGKLLKLSYVQYETDTLLNRSFSIRKKKRFTISEEIYYPPFLSVFCPPPDMI